MTEISKRTIAILKNFANINESFYYTPENGNDITTKSARGDVAALATVQEAFPVEFAIYKVNDFLSCLSMFENPTIDFRGGDSGPASAIIVREKGVTRGGLTYGCCNPALIVYPKKKPSPPPANFSFMLSDDQLSRMDKASKVLSVEDLILLGDADGVHIVLTDAQNSSSNDFELTVSGESQGDFRYPFKVAPWRVLPATYNVDITIKETENGLAGLAFLTSEDGTLRYGISMQKIVE
jgi:hypothetical protein